MGNAKQKAFDRLKNVKYTVDENGCHVVTNYKPTTYGYRRIKVDGEYFYVHRLVYELHNGEILEGYVVRHTCDNTHCINPEHLVVGTQRDNVNDMLERKRHKHKLTPEDREQIRLFYEDGVLRVKGKNPFGTITTKEIADIYDISLSRVSRIINGAE
jgi:HNH endonuclease/Sigma-70, region 4